MHVGVLFVCLILHFLFFIFCTIVISLVSFFFPCGNMDMVMTGYGNLAGLLLARHTHEKMPAPMDAEEQQRVTCGFVSFAGGTRGRQSEQPGGAVTMTASLSVGRDGRH